MFESKSHHKIKVSTERNFGFVFATVFFIIGFYPILFEKNIHYWACIIACIFLLLALIYPKSLTLPNRLWFKLGLFLGSIISPIVMGVVFFLTVTPTGIIMRLLNKDILNKKIKKTDKSYWINRQSIPNSMKNQF